MNLFFTEPLGSVEQPIRCVIQNRTLRLIMRISCLNMFLLIGTLKLLSASPVSGQGLENIKVTLEFNNETLKNVFGNIEKQTGLLFAYPHEKVNTYSGISLPKGRYTVKEVLDLVLEGTSLKYRKTKKHIIIFSPSQEETGKTEQEEGITGNETPLLMLSVTGKVIDSQGLPMAAVNIVVRGTTRGTTSDTNGNYSIDAGTKDVLVFSFIGFKVVETQVNERTVIDITMEDDVTTLGEVQINGGYYTTTQATSTGNIARVTSKEISGQPVSNPLQALQGRMAGVEIIQQSGVPGVAMKIQIRGQNSLRDNGNYPLYIIDGVPVTSTPITSYGTLMLAGADPLNTINPENIESIEILKDADATAIYGSRGANGVILITTKKSVRGKEGKTELEGSFYRGAGKANQVDDLLSSKQYLTMRREAFKNDNATPTPTNARDLMVWDTTRNTNWQKKLFGGTAHITDAQLALSGGNATTSFRLSTGYHRETMVFPGDFGYNRASGSLSVNHQSNNEKFNATIKINYGVDRNDLFDGDLITPALNLPPVAPAVYTEDGSLNWQIGPSGPWANPLASTWITHNIKSYNLITNTVLSYELFPGLSIRTNLGYTNFASDEVINTPLSSFDPTNLNAINSTALTNNSSKSWIAEPQLIYQKAFGNSKLNLMAGSTWQSSTINDLSIVGQQYASDELLGDLSSAAVIIKRASGGTEYRYNAFFGRIGYNWNDKYLINLTGRRDGSSRFGPDKKFANFGAVGLGWVFSNEGFIQDNISFLSFGKLRGSYGTTGSDNIPDYGYLDTYTATNFTYQNISGLYPSALFNPDYAWEINKKLEAGLDVGFAEDRVLLSASWYRNRSSNQLVGYPLPNITGFSGVIANLPATVQNTGWEFVLNTTNIQSNTLRWVSYLNLTIPKNKLVAYPNIEGSAFNQQYTVGEPLNSVRVFNYLRVDPQTGLYQFEDVNVDGDYDFDDKKAVVRLGRKYYGGIGNSLIYKGVELNFLFEFVKQEGYNRFVLFNTYPGRAPLGLTGNQPSFVLDRWQQDGDRSDIQKFTQASINNVFHTRARQSEIAFSDASFIRLKTISIGYTLPTRIIEKTRLQNCRIYIQGQNLLTFTKYIGLDPQNPGQKFLPALKMVTGGIQFKF